MKAVCSLLKASGSVEGIRKGVRTNALEALVLPRERCEPEMRLHPGDELARLERASES